MKLSEAIRLGAMLGPQIKGRYFSESGDNGTCAMGSAMLASGIKDTEMSGCRIVMLFHFPILRMEAIHPITQKAIYTDLDRIGGGLRVVEYRWTVEGIIVNLNDSRNLTREQIADWVETIEKAQEPKTEEVKELVTA